MAVYSVATGALAPVLSKLSALLGDEHLELAERTRSDAMFIRSQLEAVHSLLLPRINWGMTGEDVDALCKDELMAAVRELSYDIDDAIDDFFLEGGDGGPFDDELKTRVDDVSKRFSDSRYWRPPVEQHQPSLTAATVDSPPPHARFVHNMMDVSEFVEMEQHLKELIKLLEQGADTSTYASRKILWSRCRKESGANRTIHLDGRGIRLNGCIGEVWVELDGEGANIRKLLSTLRNKAGHAQFVQVEDKGKKVEETTTMPCEFHEVKTVCILGLPGAGKTTLAKLLYSHHSTTEQQFQYRAFVSVSPGANLTQSLADIFLQVGADNDATPYCGTETPHQQYLIIIDDVWHWEEWEVIRKSIPKNDLGSRIIMTTRLNSIAEKCRNDDIDAFVYETETLDYVDAWLLCDKVARKSVTCMNINPCYDIVDMCYGMPLALICVSSALAEEIQALAGDEQQKWRALRRVEDGILDIPSLKPLAESLCLGYNHLPLYLRTLLLFCSVYHWLDGGIVERSHLVTRWIAEGFVSEEKEAEGYFDELVGRGWIKHREWNEYEIHPMMLAILRYKSKEYNFVTCLGMGSDTSTSASLSYSSPTMMIRRLCLQRGYPRKCLSSMDVSHIRSLVILGDVIGVPLDMFKRLRVLDLTDNLDIEDSHLKNICEQLESLRLLKYLVLMGTRITTLPQEIQKLKHLEILCMRNTYIRDLPSQIGELKHLRILDVRNTEVRELPWQAGQIWESLRVLTDDSEEGMQLPKGVCEDLIKGIPEADLAKCREVLSIPIVDRLVSPPVGIFKVIGLRKCIPEMFKDYFDVLSCLDIWLWKLEEEDHEFLANNMPNLQMLVLRFEAPAREPIIINNTGFQMLERFHVDSRVPRITFQEGAMPKLKHLEFKFYAGPPSNDPAVGITHLLSLQKVVFRCSKWYKSDNPGIKATIDVVKKEARQHPNWLISLLITEGDKEVPIEAHGRAVKVHCMPSSLAAVGSSSTLLLTTPSLAPAAAEPALVSKRKQPEIEYQLRICSRRSLTTAKKQKETS
uniref:AAA+ ATPase domain-containing protein n=1 Tax=Oryza glumipatula TaxID=40148 RepID=A0A0E0BMA0_9ORYZ